MTYRPDIDGLRAVAILLVTIFHFDLLGIGKAGFIGVDVFFVISGFLITTIIVSELDAGKFRIGHFFYRRVRRLYPALLVTLVLFLCVAYARFLPDTFRELGLEAALSQIYVINFYFWRTVNYFGLQAGSVPLLHFWSLAVEEQFYLVLPLVTIFLHRLGRRWLFAAFVTATIASFLLGYVATGWKPWAAFYLLPTRAWELLLGGVIAFHLMRRPSASVQWHTPVSVLGLTLIGIGIYLYSPATGVPGWFSLFPTTGAALLIIGGQGGSGVVTRVLSWPPVVWIGKISYPLYLVHWPILITLRHEIPDLTLAWRFAGFLLSFVFAWGIYALVETPIRTERILTSARRFLLIAGMASVSILIGSVVITKTDGLPGRFQPEVNDLLLTSKDTATAFRHCRTELIGADFCLLGDSSQPPSYLFLGDSHANAYARALDLWLTRVGKSGAFIFEHDCLPIANLGDARCREMNDIAAEIAASTPEIETVVLLSIWRFANGKTHDGKWVTGAALDEVVADELATTVLNYKESGRQVVLVDPMFSLPQSAPHALARNAAFGSDWPTTKEMATHLGEFRSLLAAFEHAETVGAQRISLLDMFCDATSCRGTLDGKPIFSDGNHLADWMSESVSHVFQRKFSTLSTVN